MDAAYSDLVISVGSNDQPPAGALHSGTATNLVAQIGSISTARETRLVAAETRLPAMLWVLLVGGGAFVVVSIFAVTMSAGRETRAGLVSITAVFTVVLILLVVALRDPFGSGSGRVTPRLINETTTSMTNAAPPSVAAPCDP